MKEETLSNPEAFETPSREQVVSDALLALRIRSLIADKEMITAQANETFGRCGAWNCDYSAWYQKIDAELQELFKKAIDLA